MLKIPLIVRIAISVSFVLLLHFSVTNNRPYIALGAVALFATVFFLKKLASPSSALEQLLWLGIAAIFLFATFSSAQGAAVWENLLIAPAVLINLFLALFFGQSVLPGKTPVITRIRLLEEASPSPFILRYTRYLTIAWSGFFVAAFLLILSLSFFLDLQSWSWVANVGAPLASIAFFLFEHLYRFLNPDKFGPTSPLRTLRLMLHPGFWSQPS